MLRLRKLGRGQIESTCWSDDAQSCQDPVVYAMSYDNDIFNFAPIIRNDQCYMENRYVPIRSTLPNRSAP